MSFPSLFSTVSYCCHTKICLPLRHTHRTLSWRVLGSQSPGHLCQSPNFRQVYVSAWVHNWQITLCSLSTNFQEIPILIASGGGKWRRIWMQIAGLTPCTCLLPPVWLHSTCQNHPRPLPPSSLSQGLGGAFLPPDRCFTPSAPPPGSEPPFPGPPGWRWATGPVHTLHFSWARHVCGPHRAPARPPRGSAPMPLQEGSQGASPSRTAP